MTPDTLAAAYDYLRHNEPFSKWNLPSPHKLKFKVAKTTNCAGWCKRKSGNPDEIAISIRCVSSPFALMPVMAHEMVHLHQYERGTDTTSEHNAEFHKLAKRVCKKLTFDYAAFV